MPQRLFHRLMKKKNNAFMKKVIALLFIFFTLCVSAHEFWLQPDKYIYKKGEKLNIKFRVGENFEGENWNNNRSKINFLKLYSNGTTKNLAPLISDNMGDSLQLTLPDDGTMMIVYNGLNSFIELEAAKFNAYLEEDGLKDVTEYRKKHQETDSMGKEAYQRSVKTLLQVGNKYDSTYLLKTDLPVDIIPLSNPYTIKEDQKLSAQILFNKKPLAFTLINIWHRENNKTARQQLTTNEFGEISFPVKKTGSWMLSTVKMVRLENEPKANWQSYWGSCTWGYE